MVAREHRRTQSDSASIAKRLSVTQSLHYRAPIVTSRFVLRSLVTWKPCLKTPAISKFLRRGPRAWKAWRSENPEVVPNLSGLTLRVGQRQMGPINGGPINLSSTRLRHASLCFATLTGAGLSAADLWDADLSDARLDRVNLAGADLSEALLDRADFAGTSSRALISRAQACLRHAT